jgi:hypothetical protein
VVPRIANTAAAAALHSNESNNQTLQERRSSIQMEKFDSLGGLVMLSPFPSSPPENKHPTPAEQKQAYFRPSSIVRPAQPFFRCCSGLKNIQTNRHPTTHTSASSSSS